MDRAIKIEEIKGLSTINIFPGSNFNDILYTTQEWWDNHKLSIAIRFLDLALQNNLISNGIFSLENQIKAHNLVTPQVEYYPIIILPFKQENSKGKLKDIYVIRNGHHRIWVARTYGITIEGLVDESANFKNIPRVNNIVQLNQILDLEIPNLKVYRNRAIERQIRPIIIGSEQ